MTIREYTDKDGCGVISLWNECLSSDVVDENNFYKRVVCDANFDPALFLLAELDGETVGFAYGATLGADQGWIVAMGVRSAYRCKGIGSAMLSALEAALHVRGAKNIALGSYPCNYFFPGADRETYCAGVAFFKTHGYIDRGTCVSMDLNLRGYQPPQRYLAKKAERINEGYVFTAFRLQDSMPLLFFLAEHFPHWMEDVRKSILADRAEKTILLAWTPNNAIGGFVMRSLDGTEERFGPFGVSPSLQGLGLGGILFHEMMQHMIAARIFYTYFLWTGGRNVSMYAGWNMKVYREYLMMGKKL